MKDHYLTKLGALVSDDMDKPTGTLIDRCSYRDLDIDLMIPSGDGIYAVAFEWHGQYAVVSVNWDGEIINALLCPDMSKPPVAVWNY